jgi:hypothetical protein
MLSLLSRQSIRILGAVALFLALGQSAFAAGEASRVRILLVIDTDTKGAVSFGAGHDRDNMRATLLKGLKAQNMPYTLDVLQGANATKERIYSYYENLKSGPNEALFFYYTGHGATHKEFGQVLCLHHGVTMRKKIRMAMMKNAPRLAVIMTDCCSSGMEVNATLPSEGPAPKNTPVARPARSGSVLRDLLFRQEGLVVITAAKVGTDSTGTRAKGSYFTLAFCQLLNAAPSRFDYNKDGFVEWREFFPTLRQETVRISGAGNNTHTPQAFFLAQPFQK